jgi:hypothetical protein
MPKRTDRQTTLPEFVGVVELARIIGRHPDTVRRWGYEEGMPYHQPAGGVSKWLIDVAEFDRWFRSRCSTPNGTPPKGKNR